jgi:glucose/arabinose dehydrogenase
MKPPAGIVWPQVEYAAHTAALGLIFYDGNRFPAKYRGGVFVAEHGSWNRTKPIGYRIMFSSLKADGTVDKTEVFADGFLDKETGIALGRPVDVAQMKDGSLLVSDDFAGALYRITYTGE